MNRHATYCTEEQTRKAIALGAPIIKNTYAPIIRYETCGWIVDDNKEFVYLIPTADEMVGWLEEQRLFIHIDYDFHANDKPYKCEMCLLTGLTRHCGWFISRKKATIAAIDAALDYLNEHRK